MHSLDCPPTGRIQRHLRTSFRFKWQKHQAKTDALTHFFGTTSNDYSPLVATHVPSTTAHNTVDTPATPINGRFIREQSKDTYCRTMTWQVGRPNMEFFNDLQGLLVCRSIIDGAIQIAVPTLLPQRVITLEHYFPIARRPGQRRMYNTLWLKLFWPHMVNEAYNTVTNAAVASAIEIVIDASAHFNCFLCYDPLIL